MAEHDDSTPVNYEFDDEETTAITADFSDDEPTRAIVPPAGIEKIGPAASPVLRRMMSSSTSRPVGESSTRPWRKLSSKAPRTPRGLAVLTAIAVALALLLASIIFFVVRSTDTPERAVNSYLSAVSRGDAAAALSYIVAPDDTSLLTDAALKDAIRVKDISVKKKSADSVEATYSLDGEKVTATFTVTKNGSRYRVTNPVATIQLPRTDKLSYAISGTRGTAGKPVMVFPGGYAITPSDPRLALTGLGVVKAPLPTTYSPKATLSLSSDGNNALRAKAKESLAACAAQKVLAPTNCPYAFAAPAGQTVNLESVEWRIKTDPTPTAEFIVNEQNLTAVSQPLTFTLTLTASITKADGTVYAYEEDNASKAAADFDLTDPAGGLIWRV